MNVVLLPSFGVLWWRKGLQLKNNNITPVANTSQVTRAGRLFSVFLGN